jgi:hypothetical protein
MSSPVRPFRPEPTLAARGRLASVADIWGRIRRVFLAFQVPNNKGKPGRRSGLCRRRSCGSKIEEIGRFLCINQPSVALTVRCGVTRKALFRLDFTPFIADDLIMAGGGGLSEFL